MTSNDIRKRFLDFFAARGHRVVPSSPLVPLRDPTLLFSNAGMNQFKDVFLGREKRDYTRACSVQKCVRAGGKHNDLEQVGRTTRHHTFFEMLGSFSFGDYFKKEAIPWAWELVTKDFAIPREKLYVTVFREDDEAAEIWAKIVPRERIFRFDEKDNFWAMGDTGPCGPCSEIHYDLGPAASDLGHKDCTFPCDCGRYVEIWNLVFMQFNRNEEGKLTPLPRPSIDTGAGLERLATALQGKTSNFDTDLFRPLIEEAAELANVEYGANHDTDISLRIIADHARAATFLISDGVLPSNEGRGYVLRLILRRALYHGQTLGLNEPFMFKLGGRVVDLMKGAYPELAETAYHVAKSIRKDEEAYGHTTRVGLERLEKTPVVAAGDLNEAEVVIGPGFELPFSEWKIYYGRTRLGPAIVSTSRGIRRTQRPLPPPGVIGWIPGDELFRLHDTFGLRPDFVEDIVRNYELTVDREGYEAEMRKQRERARASWKAIEKSLAKPAYVELARRHSTEFLGYETTHADDCEVIAIIERGTDRSVSKTTPGVGPVEHEVVLDKTPFYAEAGGQVGDTGWFLVEGEHVARVEETYSPVAGVIAHYIKPVSRRGLRLGDKVTAVVDSDRRNMIRRNHTGTHLLHAALRTALGTHVKQAGSLVAPDRLRFDFTHYAPLGEQDLLDIEDLVNEHVLKNEDVVTTEMDLDAAVNSGAMALFGEKYSDRVRVVSIEDGSFSKELCGGTHVRRTGDIGLFKIVSEASVSAGTRRIEALTGEGVLKHLRQASETLALLSETLRAKPDELLQTAEKLAQSEKKLRKQLEAHQTKHAAAEAGDLVDRAKDVKGVRVISERVEATHRTTLRQMIDSLRGPLGTGVIVLGSVVDGKVNLIAAVTKDLTSRLDAGKIIKAAAAIVEGTGGGRKDLAEAGGTRAEKLEESLQAVPSIVEKML